MHTPSHGPSRNTNLRLVVLRKFLTPTCLTRLIIARTAGLEITAPIGRQNDFQAYYYSPNTTGTWHVSVDVNIAENGTTQYQGSGSASVTVTNP